MSSHHSTDPTKHDINSAPGRDTPGLTQQGLILSTFESLRILLTNVSCKGRPTQRHRISRAGTLSLRLEAVPCDPGVTPKLGPSHSASSARGVGIPGWVEDWSWDF